MKEISGIDELHTVLLDMGKELHRICSEEKIPYFMVAGTLLGAVRHKGFIPWDDDMDFGVPRAYYSRLKTAMKRKLPPYYRLMDREDGIVVSGICKIVDERTLQKYRWSVDSTRTFGVNIDIFPLDYTKSKWRRKFIQHLRVIQGYKGLDIAGRTFIKKLVTFLIRLLTFYISVDGIQNIIDNKLMEKSGCYIVNHYGAYGEREVMPQFFFDEQVLMEFEDTQLYGIKHAPDYLSKMYGDYMQIPPREKRHTHISKVYWK